MPHKIIMPALGMSQETGKIIAWLKQEGEHVNKGEILLEIETDKTTVELEALSETDIPQIGIEQTTDDSHTSLPPEEHEILFTEPGQDADEAVAESPSQDGVASGHCSDSGTAPAQLLPGWYAISTDFAFGTDSPVSTGNGMHDSAAGRGIEDVIKMEPVDRVGWSLLIFHINDDLSRQETPPETNSPSDSRHRVGPNQQREAT